MVDLMTIPQFSLLLSFLLLTTVVTILVNHQKHLCHHFAFIDQLLSYQPTIIELLVNQFTGFNY